VARRRSGPLLWLVEGQLVALGVIDLVETDSPFLSPPGGPRGRNEPEWVRITATWVSDQRSVDGTDAAAVAAFGEGLVQTYDRTFGTGGRQA
jgi:hypothetical protein